MNHIYFLEVIFHTISFLITSGIAYYSFKTYRKTSSRRIMLISIGFTLIAIGIAIDGIFFSTSDFYALHPHQNPVDDFVNLVEALFILFGFGTIMFAIYRKEGSDD